MAKVKKAKGAGRVGENVAMKIEDGKLVITVDLKVKGRPSGSGKTTVIASTLGNVAALDSGAVLGLNVYRKKA